MAEDLWANDAGEDAFALPGDDQILGHAQQQDEQPAGRPRDPDTGRFVASQPEQEAEAETAEEAAADAAETVQEPEAEAAEATDPKIAEYERRLAEKEQLLQRQANEVGELRKLVEERLTSVEQRQQAPQVSDWDTLIDEDPYTAIEIAYQRGDQVRLQQAARAWEDVAPGAVKVWALAKQQEQQFAAKIAELEQRVGPVAQQADEQAMGQEMARVIKQYPDLDDHAAKMNEIVQRPGNEHLLAGLESGTAQSRVRVVETLYALAKLETGDTLRAAAQDIARRTSEEENRARDEAVVVSASRSTPDTTPSLAERIGAEWAAMEDPLKDGWNI